MSLRRAFNVYRGGGSPAPVPVYFRDSYNYTYGWSLRQLDSTALYCAKVRRSSDNATMDVGFVYNSLSNQYIIDIDSVLAWSGSDSVYIHTLYHQGGSNHLLQTTNSLQPILIGSGTPVESNGNPSILFNSTQYLTLTTSISCAEPFSIFQVMERFSGQLGPVLSSSGATAPFALMWNTDGNVYQRSSTNTQFTLSSYSDIQQVTLAGVYDSGVSTTWKNGVSLPMDSPIALGGVGDFVDFGRREATISSGYCSEIIFFNSNQSASSVAIQNNQADFWNTYISPNRTDGYAALIVGQSNGTDRFDQSALPGSYTSPIPDGWTYFKPTDTTTDDGSWQRQVAGVNTTIGGGIANKFAWSFTAAYRMKQAHNKALYVIPTCVGGTGLDNSFVPGWDPDHVAEYYDRSVTVASQAVPRLSNITAPLVLLIDHGQTDATDGTTAANYEANLTAWINAYRAEFGAIPVVIILLNQSSIYTYTSTVRTAQENVAATLSDILTLDGDNYALAMDGEHYTSAAAVQLGLDMADLISTI